MTYGIPGVQRVVFALSKNLHQLKDFIVDLGHQAPQDVSPHAPQLNLLQLQKFNGRFVKILAWRERTRTHLLCAFVSRANKIRVPGPSLNQRGEPLAITPRASTAGSM